MKKTAFIITMTFILAASASDSAERPATTPPVSAVSNAVSGGVANTTGMASDIKVEQSFYEYSADGRRDPFMSIISSSRQDKEIKGKTKSRAVHPLEQYDVAQLRLVAIVVEASNKYALVTLPNGQSFNVGEGVRVGVNDGKVVKISDNAVTIREHIKDISGAMAPKDTTLKLLKED